MAIGLEII